LLEELAIVLKVAKRLELIKRAVMKSRPLKDKEEKDESFNSKI